MLGSNCNPRSFGLCLDLKRLDSCNRNVHKGDRACEKDRAFKASQRQLVSSLDHEARYGSIHGPLPDNRHPLRPLFNLNNASLLADHAHAILNEPGHPASLHSLRPVGPTSVPEQVVSCDGGDAVWESCWILKRTDRFNYQLSSSRTKRRSTRRYPRRVPKSHTKLPYILTQSRIRDLKLLSCQF